MSAEIKFQIRELLRIISNYLNIRAFASHITAQMKIVLQTFNQIGHKYRVRFCSRVDSVKGLLEDNRKMVSFIDELFENKVLKHSILLSIPDIMLLMNLHDDVMNIKFREQFQISSQFW